MLKERGLRTAEMSNAAEKKGELKGEVEVCMCVSINVKRTKKRMLYYKNSCITEIREA